MSKAKDTLEELRTKLFDKKKQETVVQATELIDQTMDFCVYDVIQDPKKSNRAFLIVKLKYDLDTKTATVVEVKNFEDKAAGMSILLDKENRKYLFGKNRSQK